MKNRPYKCPYCAKQFRTATRFEWHLQNNCPDAVDKPMPAMPSKVKRKRKPEGFDIDYSHTENRQPTEQEGQSNTIIQDFNRRIEIYELQANFAVANELQRMKQEYKRIKAKTEAMASVQ